MILIQSKSSSSHRHPSPSPQRWENHSRIVVIYCLLLRLLFHRPIQHQFSNNSNKNTQHHQPQQPTKIIFFPMMLRKNEKKWKEDHLWIAVLLIWCSVLFYRLHTAPHTTTYHKYIDAYANDDENKLLWVFIFFYFSISAIKWVHFYYFVNCEAKTKNMQRTEKQGAESREWRGIV